MALSDFTPSVEDVASHMRGRLNDQFDNEFDTFTAESNPPLKWVEGELARGARRVASHIGTAICNGGDAARQAELYADAKDLAALAIAVKAERSFFPDQMQSEISPYKAMLAEYKESIATLIEAVAEHCGGGGGESVGGTGPMPSSNFPPPSGIALEVM